MNRSLHRLALLAVVAASYACATPDQRTFYRQAIDKFSAKLPKAPTTCWLAPDLTGGGAGSNAIAEEVFTAFLLDKGLCRVVEKHPDANGGYEWPTTDLCPCGANVQSCSAQCAGGAGAALGGLGGFGGGSGSGDDNNRSNDKLLERYKKSQLPQKLVAYRIDELTQKKAVVHFRVSDIRTSVIEASSAVTIELESAPARREE